MSVTKKTIPLFKVFMPKSVTRPLIKTLFSGYIGQGSMVEEFEKRLAEYLGNPYVLTLNTGTSAIHLALRLANIGPGDEVISTPLTCVATNWPILAAGASIVWADIDLQTACVDTANIADKINYRTKAIIVVDWGGQPVDIDAIRSVAYRRDGFKKIPIPIIEDAAHAFGAIYKGKKVGNAADYTIFSFQAIKHLTTVDGGLLAVHTKSDYDRGRLLRWYGIDRNATTEDSRIEIDVVEWGYKFHMNDVAATIGLEQLHHVNKTLTIHRDNAKYYDEVLNGQPYVIPLKQQPSTISSYWLYTLRVKNRNKFRRYMVKNGIMVSAVHRRNDTHPVVSQFRTKLPKLDKFEKEMICIPVGWWVGKKDREKIARLILKYKP